MCQCRNIYLSISFFLFFNVFINRAKKQKKQRPTELKVILDLSGKSKFYVEAKAWITTKTPPHHLTPALCLLCVMTMWLCQHWRHAETLLPSRYCNSMLSIRATPTKHTGCFPNAIKETAAGSRPFRHCRSSHGLQKLTNTRNLWAPPEETGNRVLKNPFVSVLTIVGWYSKPCLHLQCLHLSRRRQP